MPGPIAHTIGAGYTAVSLFFILSGYILTYNYVPDPDAPALDRRQFWIARVARIYPVYVFSLLLALPRFLELLIDSNASASASALDTTRVLGSSLLMVQAWFPSLAYRLNWASWSLSAEAFFYALFPLLVPFVCSRRVRRHPVVVGAILWIVSVSVVMVIWKFSRTPMAKAVMSRNDWFTLLSFAPIFRLPEFVLGMLLGIAYPAGSARVSPRTGQLLTLGALAMLVVLLPQSNRLPIIPLRTGLLMPVFGMLIVGLAVGKSAVTRFLSRPSLLLLGEASYSIYILHTPIHSWLRGVDMLDGGLLFSSPLWIPLYVAVTISVSILTLRELEIPARAYVRRKFTRLSGRAPLVAPSGGPSPA